MPHPRKKVILGASLAILAVIGLAATAIHYTSSNQFCLSCHEMRVHQRELALSAHARDADGNAIGCAQCHIPSAGIVRMVGAKSWLGARDVWAHFTGGAKELDRAQMQIVARRFTDDHNCRVCHVDLTRNARGNAPISAEGALAHDNYLGKNGQARSGCVGCHMNLAHLPVFDAWIPANRNFAFRVKEIGNE